ncbi:GRAM domain-containing protein 2B-like [Mercenaria mercenaria]|uniref:GRAM domain-containing protein 2B-like n=1 Tax=Mercenaria mercenaria TaxID=6596 RepID=UPI00234FAE1B|nr:GRAM domain-containing protein 2B-like [Mercenaria mercenaria]
MFSVTIAQCSVLSSYRYAMFSVTIAQCCSEQLPIYSVFCNYCSVLYAEQLPVCNVFCNYCSVLYAEQLPVCNVFCYYCSVLYAEQLLVCNVFCNYCSVLYAEQLPVCNVFCNYCSVLYAEQLPVCNVFYFSCAYIGDILLQGNLYVSQNWFCFYSRIRGRGRLLEIPMDSVISITREKTAIIFPNAIGLQTKNDKYAFGSFISRDNTYKFFVSMWKKSQEAKTSEGMDAACETLKPNRSSSSFTQEGLLGKRDNSFTNNAATNGNVGENLSNQSHSNSKSDSSDNSDSSICIESGSVDVSDINEASLNDLSVKTDSNSSPVRQVSRRSNKRVQKMTNQDKKVIGVRKKALEGKTVTSEGKRLQFPYSVMHCIDRQKTIMALQNSASKLQKIPRTNLLLAICTLLLLFLMLSAVGLTYKILNLETKISSRNLWTEADHNFNRDKTYLNIMGLQSVMRESTAEHVQNILKANLKILHEINSSLQSLKKTSDKPETV